ncbi:MAG: DUF29 family protein [Acetobacteraceae bacterium]
MSDPYDTDVVTWSERRAPVSRRLAAGERVNSQVDWENVTEEIGSVGRNQIDTVEAWLFQALIHDLQATGWLAVRDVSAWRGKARGFRARARRKYRPSTRRKIDLSAIYSDALKAPPDTLDGEPPRPVPPSCPLTLEEIIAGA